MSEAKALPDYHRCLPVELHSQADAYIRYLHDLPNRSPVECPDCGHPRFRLDTSLKLRLPFYRCAACNKGFNCLTKTPLSGFGMMHRWSTYAHYLLAGWPMQNVAIEMGISPSTTYRWIKPCRAVMAKEFPELHQWWAARQDRTNLEPPAHIAAQAKAFLDGLQHLLVTEKAVCNRCGSTDVRRSDTRRPDFRCQRCWTNLSLLHGTLLCRLGYPEHWPGYVQGLINGESTLDLQRRTGLCGQTCERWRKRFMQLFDEQGHTELARWITWMRSRRVKEVSDFVKAGGKLEVVTGSRYSAGSKRRFAYKSLPKKPRKEAPVS